MPELPEVETVRRGLAPFMEGGRLTSVTLNRPDLRFPFPKQLEKRLKGWRISAMDRRAKYLLLHLTSGETLIVHLGMSGRFFVEGEGKAAAKFHQEINTLPKHNHVIFGVDGPEGPVSVIYNDTRRFGYMDLIETSLLDECKHFEGMGPEPLGNHFSVEALAGALAGKGSAIKQALLDQRVVAGLGNIYVCEALYQAGISPKRKAGSVSYARLERLVPAIREILQVAIDAGGSSLKDFAGADGVLGYFQHSFKVYDREGAPCEGCERPIKRIVQAGRSTFYCSNCQR